MNRSLQYFNLFGVAALAVLCVLQWQTNRHANLETSDLLKTSQQQSVKIQEQEKSLKGYASDLDDFRGQLAHAHAAFKENEAKVAVQQRQIQQLASESEQLRSSVTNWTAAVKARDEQLQIASQRLQEMAADRNAAVAKYNGLADKYNGVVKDLNAVIKDLNEARARLASLATNAPAK